MAQRFKAKTLLSNSGVFNNEVIAPNLVYNTGNQNISGNKIFKNNIQIGDSLNAIYSDQDDSLVISGNQTTLRTLRLIAAGGIYNTSITFGPGADGLAFNSPDYFFRNKRPEVRILSPFSSRPVALLDEVVLNTGNQTISGVKNFATGIFAPNLVYNTGNQIISGNLTISGHYEDLSTLSVQRVSGMNNLYGGSLIIQGVNDQTIFMNPVGVTYPGSILLNPGTGLNNGTGTKGKIEFLGNIDINTVNPFLAGDFLKNSRESAQRKINIWKTGITNDGFLRGYSGITIDNENIYLNTPVGGATGFGLIISGVQVTPNLYVNTTSNQTISGIKTFATGVVVSGNLQVSGTGIFNALDLNNIDNLSFSGVDVTITSGNVILTNPVVAPNIVYNTGNQTISGIKTFIGNQNISGNVTVSGNIINSGIADIFPASSTKRRYYPEGFLTTSSASPIYQSIQYFPFLIKKDAVNPKICVEVTSVGSVAAPIRYGIYSGNNGFEGAKLFHSGSIDCLNVLGVYTGDINTTLVKGPYIIATSNTGVNGGQPSFRTFSTNTVRSIFGEPTGFSTFSISSPHYNETGIDLLTTIGSGIINSAVQAPAPAIIY